MCSIRIAGNEASTAPSRASVHTSHGDGQIWITGHTNSHRYSSVMRKTVSKCNPFPALSAVWSPHSCTASKQTWGCASRVIKTQWKWPRWTRIFWRSSWIHSVRNIQARDTCLSAFLSSLIMTTQRSSPNSPPTSSPPPAVVSRLCFTSC